MFPLSLTDHVPTQPAIARWSIHGVVVEWRAADPRLIRLIRDLMRGFPTISSPPDILVELSSGPIPAIPSRAKRLPASNNEIVDNRKAYGLDTVFARHETLNYYALTPMAGAAYAIDMGRAIGWVDSSHAYTDWQLSHLFLVIVLLELLRGQGLFWLHASCVARQGRGALFVGQTRSGKTTTAVNLALQGFDILSEDRAFVGLRNGEVTMYGFPLEVAVTDRTVELLPALAAYLSNQSGRRGKHRLPIDVIFPDRLAGQCKPVLLMFSHIELSLPTTAYKISRADALRRLLPNSILASQPGVTGQHFTAISTLVQSCQCYDLALGPDVDAIARLIGELIDEE